MLGTRKGCVVNVTNQLLSTWECPSTHCIVGPRAHPGWVQKILPLTGFNPRAIQPIPNLYTYCYYTIPPVTQEVTENSKTGYGHLRKVVQKAGGIRLNNTAQWHVYNKFCHNMSIGPKVELHTNTHSEAEW
jgi:hypothetical protein